LHDFVNIVKKYKVVGGPFPKVNKKVLLLYSGGLDTSVMLKWLNEKLGYNVVALTLDVGQRELNLDSVAEKARNIGALDTITMDVKHEFVDGYVSKSILSDGLYEDSYPLSTSIARPLMAEKAVEVAHDYDCNAIAHGCTGKGNDQVRFETSIHSLDPSMDVLAPVREWNMNRDDEIEYAKEHGIPVPVGGKYSVDENLWGRSVEGSVLEDPLVEPPEDAYFYVTPPWKCKDTIKEVKIGFEKGLPVKLNGQYLPLITIVNELTKIAGENGYGAIDHIENRVTGIKSREFYECPAALSILEARKKLESLTLNDKELKLKKYIDDLWANNAYNGLWHDPIMNHLNKTEKSLNEFLSGEIILKFYKGNCIVTGAESPNSLYNYSLSTYGREQTFDQGSAAGFIKIFGMQTILSSNVRNGDSHKLRAIEEEA
jgi:argininosuccinate synthase